MMKGIMKKAVSAAVSMLMLCMAVPALPAGALQIDAFSADAMESDAFSADVVESDAFSAGAAESDAFSTNAVESDATAAATGSVTLSEDGVLTLSGAVTKEQIWEYGVNKSVTSVVAEPGTVLPRDCSKLFAKGYSFWTNLKSIDLSCADTSGVVKMSSMFSCKNIDSSYSYQRICLSGINTSKVTNMGSMFYGCSKLTELDVSSFDTSKVKTMSHMFYGCTKLTELDVSRFDTSNVTDMHSMFSGSLTKLDVSSFDTSNVTNMAYMFSYCSKLTELDVSGFDTSNVTNMACMFFYCSKLTELDLSSFNTSNVSYMDSMFWECNSIKKLDVSSFDTSNVTDMNRMFDGCNSLTELDVSSFDTSNVTDMAGMFRYCLSLTKLDVSHFDTSNVTDMNSMFYSCKSLTELDVSGFDTSNVTIMGVYYGGMFSGCSSLTKLDVSNFDTSNVTSMMYMFCWCRSLTELDVSRFDTSNVTSMSSMFGGCSSLTELDLSSFYTSRVLSTKDMFSDCSNLRTIFVSHDWKMNHIKSSLEMFSNCGSLVGGNGTVFDSSKTDKVYARIDRDGTPGYFTFSGNRVTGVSLTLASKIGIRFYAELSPRTAKAVLEGPAGTVEITDLESMKLDDGRYRFIYEVNTLQANEDVALKFYDAEGKQLDVCNSDYQKKKSKMVRYSVNKYISNASAYQDDAQKAALVAALDNYCKASENYFQHKSNTVTGIENVNKSSFAEYAPKLCGNKIALVLNSGTEVRIYTDAETASYNGNALVKNTRKGYFAITDIPAKKLGRKMTVKVGSDTMTFSPLSYGYLAMNTNDTALQTLVRAMYVYAQAAAEY